MEIHFDVRDEVRMKGGHFPIHHPKNSRGPHDCDMLVGRVLERGLYKSNPVHENGPS